MDFSTDAWMGITFVLVITGVLAWFVIGLVSMLIDLQKAKIEAGKNSAQGHEYRTLARQATQSQAEVAEQLKRLESIDARLGEVERMLREVDEPALSR